MKKVLVIATGAKKNGALIIVNKFVSWCATKDDNFIIITPKIFVPKSKNIHHIKIKTSNLMTPLFTTIISIFYAIRYKPDIFISFNNVPLLFANFFRFKSYLYFHNVKIISKKNLKSLFYKFLIKHFSEEIIVQTPFSKKIIKKFTKKKTNIIWPGLLSYNNKNSTREIDKKNSKIIFYPVSNPFDPNKNFKFILGRSDFFINNNIKIMIPANRSIDLNNKVNKFLIFKGNLDHKSMMMTYKKCHATLFLSIEESCGLPIYESLYNSKPTFVLKKNYIKSNLCMFKKDPLLILFNKNQFEKTILSSLNSKKINKFKHNVKLSKQYLNDNWDLLL